MIRPPSHQGPYTLCWSKDPALDLPTIPELPQDASAEDIAARDKIAAECEHKLGIARDTGSWPVKPGLQPTVFEFRQTQGSPAAWLQHQSERVDVHGNRLFSWEQLCALAFRLALRSISNFDGRKLERTDIDDQSLVTAESLQSLYEVGGPSDPSLGRHIITELGAVVVQRSFKGVRPL